MSVEDSVGLVTISAVCLPPKCSVKRQRLEGFYDDLGRRLIAGGGCNGGNADWESRLIAPRGREG